MTFRYFRTSDRIVQLFREVKMSRVTDINLHIINLRDSGKVVARYHTGPDLSDIALYPAFQNDTLET